jgi:AcrR family transcriptional regulator
MRMPHPTLHPVDAVLDAARDLVVEEGPRAAGVRSIAKRSGAPNGSVYHRFGSRDELVARAWLRAVRRFQAGFLAMLGAADPREAVVGAVRWAVSFCVDEPADAYLLLGYSRSALLDAEPQGAVAEALATVNDPLVDAIRELATRLYGSDAPTAIERVSYAVVDLPYAVLRRHLLAGTVDDSTIATLEPAVRALVSGSSPC